MLAHPPAGTLASSAFIIVNGACQTCAVAMLWGTPGRRPVIMPLHDQLSKDPHLLSMALCDYKFPPTVASVSISC